MAGVVAHRGRRGLSPLELPDIETLVSSVELLCERDEVELAPFVQSWDPGVGAMDQDRASQQDLAKYLLNRSGSGAADLVSPQGADQLIEFVRAVVGLAPGRVYIELLPALYRSLVEVLQIRDPAALHYLEPLVRTGAQPGGITVASLNYDLSIETVAGAIGVACSTGLEDWEASGEVRFEEQGVRLIKLHGSIDWTRDTAAYGGPNGGMGINRETLVLRPPDNDSLPFLLFGRREKLRPEGPFLDLRAEFARRLRRCRFLMVVGYSFSDDHVNELIAHWVNSHADRILVVVDPDFPTTWASATHPFHRSLLTGLQSRALTTPITVADQSRLLPLRERAETALATLTQCSSEDLLAKLRAP
ncbi:MAG: SIR2 family protein [Jatrophihabitantaceae bacterium]